VPSATSPAPRLDQSGKGIEEYIDDVMTLPANLAGIPAITLPFKQPQSSKKDEFPIGLQLLGQYGYDKFVLRIAEIMTKNNI
jgi:aspartyl-tRNA(Asn)/glutamyl-tRNA(Gln) amidotransferase subunit A